MKPVTGDVSPYSTARWKAFRLTILHRDLWTCQMCGAGLVEGRVSPASATVDHKTPHHGDDGLMWDASNCWAVCKHCHDGVCASIERRVPLSQVRRAKEAHRPVGLDGYPIRRGTQ